MDYKSVTKADPSMDTIKDILPTSAHEYQGHRYRVIVKLTSQLGTINMHVKNHLSGRRGTVLNLR